MKARTVAALGALGALAIAGLAAWALKAFYSGASAAELRFVLAPTAALVELAGGYRFDWTSGGYLSNELRFLIAPACAGVNFLIVAFGSLVLAFVRPSRAPGENAAILLASAAAAYGATLLANAARILVAIPLWTHHITFAGLEGDRLHELAGIAVFLGVLVVLHLAAHRLARSPVRLGAALACYAGVMIVAPLLRGAHENPAFAAHAALAGGAVLAVAAGARVLRRERQMGGPGPVMAGEPPRLLDLSRTRCGDDCA